MSLQEKHKLYISEIQNLHFEFEDLGDYEIINDILELYIGLKDMSFYEYVGNYTYTQKYYEN